jgi:hypothetical protein
MLYPHRVQTAPKIEFEVEPLKPDRGNVVATRKRRCYIYALVVPIIMGGVNFYGQAASAEKSPKVVSGIRLADDCSSQEIDPKQWKLQCTSNDFALFCDKAGEEKKCACIRGAKYYYTYGFHCSDLSCYLNKCK